MATQLVGIGRILSAITLMMMLAPPAYSASSNTDSLFHVVSPATSLFVEGAGQKKIGLTLKDKKIKALEVDVSSAVSADGSTKNKPFKHFTAPVSSADKAMLAVDLPHLGLFNLHVVALDAKKQPAGSQDIQVAALGPQSQKPIVSIGVNTHFGHQKGQLPESMNLIRRAGFGRIRDQIPWTSIEPKPGELKFPKIFDNYIADASQRGVQPLVILGQANTRTFHHLLPSNSNFLASGQPMDLFQNYVKAVVRRYGKKVKTWELWNEPNFNTKGVAKRYAELLKATHKTLKNIDPSATLIACGGAGVGGGPNGECFLDMLKYGAGKDMDGYSIHPYMGTGDPPGQGYVAHGSVVSPISVPAVWPFNAHLIQQKKSKIKKQFALWVTEIGWFSNPVKRPDPEVLQAAYFDQLYLLSRKYYDAKAVFWYDFRNDGTNAKNKEDNFGLITHDYQPKPGYVAAATLTRTLGDRPWVQSLKAAKSEPGQKIEQYGEGSDTVVAAWTNSHPGNARLPVANGRYVIRQWDGQESTARATAKAITLHLGRLPVYVYWAGN